MALLCGAVLVLAASGSSAAAPEPVRPMQRTTASPREPAPQAPETAQPIDPSAPAARPSDETLQAISLEGRRIATYHEAIAKTRARLAEQKPDLLDGARLFVVERGGAWHVLVIGREVDGTDLKGWLLRADAVFSPKAGLISDLDLFEPPKAAPADAQATLRALDAALAAAPAHVEAVRPPFDEAIFRVGRTPAYRIYLQSRSGAEGFARFGADLRGGTGQDASRLTEFGPMHGPAEAVDVPPGDGSTPTLHSHVTVDLPTATDVAAVIDRPGVAPHLVMTPHWIFRIAEDGTITWLGPNAVPPTPRGGTR